MIVYGGDGRLLMPNISRPAEFVDHVVLWGVKYLQVVIRYIMTTYGEWIGSNVLRRLLISKNVEVSDTGFEPS